MGHHKHLCPGLHEVFCNTLLPMPGRNFDGCNCEQSNNGRPQFLSGIVPRFDFYRFSYRFFLNRQHPVAGYI
jgi:hypothetical protein